MLTLYRCYYHSIKCLKYYIILYFTILLIVICSKYYTILGIYYFAANKVSLSFRRLCILLCFWFWVVDVEKFHTEMREMKVLGLWDLRAAVSFIYTTRDDDSMFVLFWRRLPTTEKGVSRMDEKFNDLKFNILLLKYENIL